MTIRIFVESNYCGTFIKYYTFFILHSNLFVEYLMRGKYMFWFLPSRNKRKSVRALVYCCFLLSLNFEFNVKSRRRRVTKINFDYIIIFIQSIFPLVSTFVESCWNIVVSRIFWFHHDGAKINYIYLYLMIQIYIWLFKKEMERAWIRIEILDLYKN